MSNKEAFQKMDGKCDLIFLHFWDRCASKATVSKESNMYSVTCNNYEYHSVLNSLTVSCSFVKYEYNLLVFHLFTFCELLLDLYHITQHSVLKNKTNWALYL